ncbi:hypothetical protein HYH03_014909 [Edaphochlamys debaryana]|uniref:Reticulon-like protein n=1 Tax=Edaphochlamys debaryana TaxID=47281 RepID=A0A836BRT9_9CHLO|nr:hypothetical protein HYH03_014909 [Edaphochlamys debaryana]|eukprot:KAG2486462.1 hypothetical protein HYH03_014909 [Edaphochlamys debaryana]
MSKKPVSIPFVPKNVEDVLLWRDVKSSALVAGGATGAFLAYTLNPFTASTIVCYLVAILSLAMFIWAQVGNFISKSGPPVPGFLKAGVSEEQAHRAVDSLLPALNKGLAFLGVLASGKDLKLSLLTMGGSYAAARVFALVTPITLAYAVVVLALSLPKVYEAKQAEVDRALAAVQAKLDELMAKFKENVLSKIPKASPPAKKVE